MLVGQRSIYVYISLYTCPSRCCVLLPVFFGRHVHYSCHCVCVRATRACETARTRSRKQNACLSLLYSVIKVPWLVCTSGVETVFCVCVKTGFFCTMKLMVMPMLCCRCFLVPLCTFRVRKTYGFGKVLTCYVTLTFNKLFFFFLSIIYQSNTTRVFLCTFFFFSHFRLSFNWYLPPSIFFVFVLFFCWNGGVRFDPVNLYATSLVSGFHALADVVRIRFGGSFKNLFFLSLSLSLSPCSTCHCRKLLSSSLCVCLDDKRDACVKA